MTDYAKEWGAVFNTAVNQFSTEIRKHSAKDPGLARGLQTATEVAKTKTSEVLGAMARLDAVKNLNDSKELKVFGDNVKALKSAVDKYLKGIEAGTKAVIEDRNRDKKALKDVAPDTYRSLKVLATQTSAILTRAEQQFGSYSKSVVKEIAKIADKQAKGMQKAADAGDEVKRKAIEEEARLRKMLIALSGSFKSSMAKANAAIQQLKQDPSLANYNAIMNKAGRDLSQNVVNITNLKNHPNLKDLKEVKALASAGALSATAARFGNGDLWSLPTNATQQVVDAAIKQYGQTVKSLQQLYPQLMK